MNNESLGNFTPNARQVLAIAESWARKLRHNFVGVEHLLLGLTKIVQGVARNVLNRNGLSFDMVYGEVERCQNNRYRNSGLEIVAVDVTYTSQLNRVLSSARKEAISLEHTYVGTEHLLLGLIVENDGLAARVLKDMGVSVKEIRQEILNEIKCPVSEVNNDPEPIDGYNLPGVQDLADRFMTDLTKFCDGFVMDNGSPMYNLHNNGRFFILSLLLSAGYAFKGMNLKIILVLNTEDCTLEHLDLICKLVSVSKIDIQEELQELYNNAKGSEETRIGRLLQRLTGKPPRKVGPPIDWLAEIRERETTSSVSGTGSLADS
jgi:hypothetical protein